MKFPCEFGVIELFHGDFSKETIGEICNWDSRNVIHLLLERL